MLSHDIQHLLDNVMERIDLSPTHEFKLSGISSVALMRELQNMYNQAVALEKAAVPQHLKNPEIPEGGNIVKLSHWKATQTPQRKA